MPSHLTRIVFRQLVASEPIVYSGCLRRRIRPQYALPRPTLPRAQRRHFLNLFQPPKREAVEPNFVPGLEKMMELAKMKRLDARLPPHTDVAQAWQSFISFKWTNKLAINDTEAQHALQAFTYLRSQPDDNIVSNHSLRLALRILGFRNTKPSPAHHELAVTIYESYCQHQNFAETTVPQVVATAFCAALCRTGSSAMARDYVLNNGGPLFASRRKQEDASLANLPHMWLTVLRGFLDEMNGLELNKTLSIMEQHNIQFNAGVTGVMAEYFARTDDVAAAKTWYERRNEYPPAPDSPESLNAEQHLAKLQESLLRLCLRQGDLEFGQSIIRDMMTTTPSKLQWDLIFEWAAGTGKGVDEIDRMMSVMEKANKNRDAGKTPILPDVDTINRLVEFAISRKDPYTAERFIALGKKRKIEPNSRTLVLQMEYRLSVNDVDGALVAYKHLQSQDLSDDLDLPIVNRLICSMCAAGRQDFETIMNVAADLSDRRARFEPATVCALATLHLARGELDDVVDLLNTHVFDFSHSERATVRDTLVEYCTNSSTSTTGAWNAYNILKQTFDETPREQRTLIMNDFFRRERADMAVHVFNHMRTHTRADTISTIETYVSCFVGIAEVNDYESLEVVHNQMKLDYNIEPNTQLLNALILAYTACASPRRALKFWDEIVSSREGPTLNSIHLAFRACELSPWGDEKAQQIWERLRKTGIELDGALWASYAAGLVGNGDVQRTVKVLERAQADNSVDMSSFM